MLHAETAAAHREALRRSPAETRVAQKILQTAWIADSDVVINAAARERVTNDNRKRETPRERWGWTRLKQRMQTHGFLERNEYKASDNVVEGKVGIRRMVVRRGMEGDQS